MYIRKASIKQVRVVLKHIAVSKWITSLRNKQPMINSQTRLASSEENKSQRVVNFDAVASSQSDWAPAFLASAIDTFKSDVLLIFICDFSFFQILQAFKLLRACICTDIYLFIWMCDIGICWQRSAGLAPRGSSHTSYSVSINFVVNSSSSTNEAETICYERCFVM